MLFGTLQTITEEDRKEFQEQIEAEQKACDAIRDLHDKIPRLLREKPRAKNGDEPSVMGVPSSAALHRYITVVLRYAPLRVGLGSPSGTLLYRFP